MVRAERMYKAGLLVAALLVAFPGDAAALKVGDKVTSIQVRDANDNPAMIPDIGRKVITLFYTDPDVKDQNESFRELLKANNLDKTKYRGLGVANLKDTWKPNFMIRRVIRDKIKKFQSTILTDTDHTLKKKWNLGDTDDKDVVIVIGKDSRVKYIKAGEMTATEKANTLTLIKQLMEQ